MARQCVVLLTTVLVCGACSGNGSNGAGGGGGMKDPPQVFLTSLESVTIAPILKVRANVAGCDKIRGIEIYNDKRFLVGFDNPAKVPLDIELPPSVFTPLYQTLGIAVQLNLRARGICEDGRENRSTGLGLSFFPVEAVVPPAMGNSTALPDAFIAEGGVGSTPTTFIGCVGTSNGTALARFDTEGKVIGANVTLPFPCTYNSAITEKNAASGTRWLIEPGVGVFAFNSSPLSPLNITASQKASLPNIGVGPDGDAIVWDNKAQPDPRLFRISKTSVADGPPVWAAVMGGVMMGNPVVSQNEVRIITWNGSIGTYGGTVRVARYRYDNGLFISASNLATIEYGFLNKPFIPAATFNASGTLVYFSFQNVGSDHTTSGVIACASDSTGGCLGGGGTWQSGLNGLPLLDTVIAATVPFSNGTLIAAVGVTKTYFLSAATGKIVNVYDAAIKPSGSLITFGAQPGNQNDFYLLNGPSNAGYPTEIVAVDSPQQGELWRVTIEGGQTPLTAMNIAIDEGHQVWLRVGTNLVRPSTNALYRMQKGFNLEQDAGE